MLGSHSQFPPPSTSRRRHGIAPPFFGNICLSWLLSVCHHSSLSERASALGSDGRRLVEEEGEGKRGKKRERESDFILWSLLCSCCRQCGGTKERRKRQRAQSPCKADGPTDGPSHGMVKPVSFARQMDGRRMGWIYPRRTHRQTDRLTDAARFDETARGRR